MLKWHGQLSSLNSLCFTLHVYLNETETGKPVSCRMLGHDRLSFVNEREFFERPVVILETQNVSQEATKY